MDDKSLFHIKSLNFAYTGQNFLFKDFNLDIPKNKVICIVGQNGSGKSTLLHILSRGLPYQNGDIQFLGKDLKSYTPKEFAKRLAMVHQKNTSPNDVTVKDLISYGRTPHKSVFHSGNNAEDDKAIAKAMQLTETTDLKDRAVASLSGGQMQRVWFAMALAQDTDVLFLDEPTSYLDIRYQLDMLKLIRKLSKEDISIVMVLHDVNQAIAYSDHIIALKNGKLILDGTVEEFVDPSTLNEVYDCELELVESEPYSIVKTF